MIENITETKEIEAVLHHLDALGSQHPDLAAGCAYYQRLLPALMQARAGAAPLEVKPGRAQQKVDRGEPVLRGEELPLSSAHLVSLFLQIGEVITADGKQGNLNGKTWGPIDQDALAAFLNGTLQGDLESIEKHALVMGLEKAVLQVIAQNCLKPTLQAWQARLMPDVDVSNWHKGICPFCGSPPILAELRGPQRGRHLRCGLCGANWPFSRLQCVYCETQDTGALGILRPEGKAERVSIQYCSECHGYVKMLVTMEPIPVGFLPVEDLATISLDIIAGNYGYRRPG